jgi:23S rRNA pseudouridine2457 synthase
LARYRYFVIYKPYQTLSQFSAEPGKKTLKDWFSVPKDVYPVGRLDYDSEGLLLLTSDPSLNHALLHPGNAHSRTYYAQLDGRVPDGAIEKLSSGVVIQVNGKSHRCKAASAHLLEDEPLLPQRLPPIRFRKTVPAPWISLTLTEGKNRQVRKMCAAVGSPVLRLVRTAMEDLNIQGWESGQIKEFSREQIARLLHI